MHLGSQAGLWRLCGRPETIRDSELRPKVRHLAALKPSSLIFKTGLVIPPYRVPAMMGDNDLCYLARSGHSINGGAFNFSLYE